MPKDEICGDSAKVWLELEDPDDTKEQIAILNVAAAMGRRRRRYFYFLALAACGGICLGLIIAGIQYITGDKSCSSAVINFQYQGIEDGLDPNGAAFDINKLKSPAVIEAALGNLGITDISAEDVRRNIIIEGVVPEDALERITVIREMASQDASYYERILDVSYFPSQYVVHLNKGGVMSSVETTEILNAVLESYRDYFMDTYANSDVLTITSNLIDYTEYDYIEAVSLLESQIGIMLSYVIQRKEQAPDFRSSETGLAFGDIETSLRTIEDIELSKLASYVENVALTNDRESFEEQYNYKIRKYTMELSELQVRLATVESTIAAYVKDPVVIVSSQESTQEITQKNEYYDRLIEKKLTLQREIAAVNTRLKETYDLLERIHSSDSRNTQEQYDYADALLKKLASTIAEWVGLTESTTEEYYSTTLFSNAYKVAVPAAYHASEGLAGIAKPPILCAGVMMLGAIVLWCLDGLRAELMSVRKREEGNKPEDKKGG